MQCGVQGATPGFPEYHFPAPGRENLPLEALRRARSMTQRSTCRAIACQPGRCFQNGKAHGYVSPVPCAVISRRWVPVWISEQFFRTGTWLLEHVTLGDRNEALAGDLLEDFRNGRTAGWYWSQVLVAIALGWFRQALAHPGVLAFATLWSVAAPSWFVYTDKIQNDATGLHGLLCRLDFPWSMVGYFGWSLTVSLTFIWTGIALYLFLQFWTSGNLGNLQFGRSLLLSGLVYATLFAGMCVLTLFLPPGHAIDRRTLTPLNAITDPRVYAMETRLFSFVTLLVTLWAGMPWPEKRRRTA
jgi:hypothetical protein